jgi:hypothetical protein
MVTTVAAGRNFTAMVVDVAIMVEAAATMVAVADMEGMAVAMGIINNPIKKHQQASRKTEACFV